MLNKVYQNKNWLEHQYWNLRKSSIKISRECGVVKSTILSSMIKHDIPRRSQREARRNKCFLTPEAYNFISGELLGDAHIACRKDCSAWLVYSSKHKEYLEWLSQELLNWGIKQSGQIRHYVTEFSQSGVWQYGSLHYPELLYFRNKFYLDGKKVVPRNLELSSTTLRQWYIGDGSLSYIRGRSPYIRFATYGFSLKDVVFLVQKLKELGMSAKRQGDNTIRLLTKSTNKFFQFIGKCPEQIKLIYGYKWNYKHA